jgi:Golgi nucleoside diphosphatase
MFSLKRFVKKVVKNRACVNQFGNVYGRNFASFRNNGLVQMSQMNCVFRKNFRREFSMNLDNEDERRRKSEVLKVRNEAKQMLNEQKREKEIAQQEGLMTIDEIMREVNRPLSVDD